MKGKEIILYPLNRVEGDLKLRLEIEGEVVKEAWSIGTMYRGIENIMIGRGPLDGLVITPRICGICSTAHLTAAAKALDMLYGVRIPDTARRIRNAALLVEILQSDLRHSIFMFMPDFANPAYEKAGFYQEAMARYAVLKGDSALQALKETKRLLEIIAILGGQWPHSSFMVPGGVVSGSSCHDITQCRQLLFHFRRWYERQILGCSLERWQEVASKAELFAWLDEAPSHLESDLGCFLRIARETRLNTLGKGHGHFISFGALDLPDETSVSPLGKGNTYWPAGVFVEGGIRPFDDTAIAEDISHAWFKGERSAEHPSHGKTAPYATGGEGEKYTWSKAPRYEGLPMETGPLADMVIADIPLFRDLIRQDGPNVMARQLARLVRPALLIPILDQWLREIPRAKEGFYQDYHPREDGRGHGLTQAPRGALGHWIQLEKGRIRAYQIITPTTWNASPRDERGQRGPFEEALVGTPLGGAETPAAVEHVIRSFDPCLVCTVHAMESGRKLTPVIMHV